MATTPASPAAEDIPMTEETSPQTLPLAPPIPKYTFKNPITIYADLDDYRVKFYFDRCEGLTVAKLFDMLDLMKSEFVTDFQLIPRSPPDKPEPEPTPLDRNSNALVTHGFYSFFVPSGQSLRSWFQAPPETWDRQAQIPTGVASAVSTKSLRDGPITTDLKQRVLRRDRQCVVCAALGLDWFRAGETGSGASLVIAHIVGLGDHELWLWEKLNDYVKDRIAVGQSLGKRGATARNANSPEVRYQLMNSADNSMILCPNHHATYEAYEWFIHPKTYELIPLVSRFKCMWGKTVNFTEYHELPKPHPKILEAQARAAVRGKLRARAPWEDLSDGSENDSDGISIHSDIPETSPVAIWDDQASPRVDIDRVAGYMKTSFGEQGITTPEVV